MESGVRQNYLIALARVAETTSDAFDEALSKGIWKQCRSLATGPSVKCSVAAFDVMSSMISNRLIFKTPSDFDSFKVVVTKSFDSPYPPTRQAAAKCYAILLKQLSTLSLTKREAMLSATQSARTVFSMKRANTLPSKSSKKKGKADEDDDDDDQAATKASAAKQPKPIPFFSISFNDCMQILSSTYTNSNSTQKVKVGIIETYDYFFTQFEEDAIEKKYGEISTHLLTQVCGADFIRSNDYRALTARKHVFFLLNEVISVQRLGEFGRMTAAKLLVNEILSSYDPSSQALSPISSKTILSTTLECLGGLIESLGSATAPVAEAINGSLKNLLLHPSFTVKIATCNCYKKLLKALPSLALPTLESVFSLLQKEIVDLTNKENKNAVIGHSYLASTIVSLTNHSPQYASLDLTSRILTTATSLIKANGNVDVVSTSVQIGWILMSGVMALGPAFVKVHLSHLLLLWKGVLHKTGKDAQVSDKGNLELKYLLHVRHYALSCIVSFLAHNSKLVTSDVARRISLLLKETQNFLQSIPAKRFADAEPTQVLESSLTLAEYHMMVKRRLLQSYIYIAQYHHVADLFPASALTMSVQTIADPERDTISKLSTAIAAGTGVLDNIWETADNQGFGVTSKIQGFDLIELRLNSFQKEEVSEEQEKHWLSEADAIDKLDRALKQPILGAVEFDSDQVIIEGFRENSYDPVPVWTSVVDLSIDLFSTLFPLQTTKVQESILEQLWNYLTSGRNVQSGTAQKRVLRSEAVLANAITTVHGALRFAIIIKGAKKSVNEDASALQHFEAYKNPRVNRAFSQIIRLAIKSNDPFIRNIAGQSYGMLSSIGGSATVSENIKYLIDQVVSNTDPNVRGGCSISLGYMMKYVGGMFAGLHLKTVLGILVSLANDPHPVVHFWAMEGINLTISSAGLGFSSYSSSMLSTLAKLYLLDSHGPDVPSTAAGNLDCLWPASTIISRCVGALVNILGPDLQEASKSQKYVVTFAEQFNDLADGFDYHVGLVKLRMLQELAIFCPQKVNFRVFAHELHTNMMIREDTPIKHISIEGLNQLIRTKSDQIFSLLDSKFEKDIWLALDRSSGDDYDNLSSFLGNWLDETATSDTSIWIDRVQAVLIKPRVFFDEKNLESSSSAEVADDVGDEGAGFAIGTESAMQNQGVEPLRWQTRSVAINLLSELLKKAFSGLSIEEKGKSVVTDRIGDIIKIAFSASTASVLELRLLGLKLLNQVIGEFKDLRDPDFQEVALLEQYQAQVSSALTPAFSADSSPELAYQAVRASATFIGSGIIKTVDRMGRILKLLTDALESCHGNLSLGDLKIPSRNSQIMLRIAVLSLWAELQVTSLSENHTYLIEIVKPHVPVLIPFWISALKEFSKLRFEPEQSGTTLAASLDQMYSAMSKSNILPIYEQSWLQLVNAIASLIEQDRELVFNILDEREQSDASKGALDITYSNEPAAFFFVLFGLCFEALVRPASHKEEKDHRLKILIALRRILHPSVCGDAIYKEIVFAETVDMLDRIVLTGDVRQLAAASAIAHGLCMNHPSRYHEDQKAKDVDDNGEEEISESVGQLFELFRVVILALTAVLPSISDSSVFTGGRKFSIKDPLCQSLIIACLGFLIDMIGVFPNVIKTDLYACVLYVFGRLLEEDDCQKTVAAQCLHIQKKLFQMMMVTRQISADTQKVIDEEISIAITQNTSALKATDTSELGLIKRRNSLLWTVVVITTCSESLDADSNYISDLSQILVESLRVPSLSKMVAGCVQSILAHTAEDTSVGKTLVEKLVPSLVLVAVNHSGKADEDDDHQSHVKSTEIVRLVLNSLVGFSISLKTESKVQAAIGLVLPLLLHCLVETGNEPNFMAYVNEKALELAGAQPDVFRKIVQLGLSDSQKAILQEVLQGQGNDNEGAVKVESETHIKLRSFGQ